LADSKYNLLEAESIIINTCAEIFSDGVKAGDFSKVIKGAVGASN